LSEDRGVTGPARAQDSRSRLRMTSLLLGLPLHLWAWAVSATGTMGSGSGSRAPRGGHRLVAVVVSGSSSSSVATPWGTVSSRVIAMSTKVVEGGRAWKTALLRAVKTGAHDEPFAAGASKNWRSITGVHLQRRRPSDFGTPGIGEHRPAPGLGGDGHHQAPSDSTIFDPLVIGGWFGGMDSNVDEKIAQEEAS